MSSTRQRAFHGPAALLALALSAPVAQARAGAPDDSPEADCGRCHAQLADRYAALRYTHPALRQRRCDDCHLPHGREPRLVLKASGDRVCTLCHAPREPGSDRARVHDPVRKGSCTSCHDPHGSNVPHMLAAPEGQLCRRCHDPADARLARAHGGRRVETCGGCHDPHSSERPHLLKPSLHEPVAQGNCDACHSPATSPTPLALSAPRARLCAGCHDERALDGGGPVRHGSGPARECSSCHEPHASNHPRLTKAPGDALCGACHRPQARKKEHAHAPMQAGCRSCHPPHNGKKKLLAVAVSVLCRSCHGGAPAAGRGERVHLPVAAGECTSCHDAHGSDLPLILNARVDRVCFGCHADAEARFATQYTHAPVAEGNCTACHSGHAGTSASHLRAPAGALCDGCHARIAREPAASSHGSLAPGTCLGCHDPHGSSVAALVREDRRARPRDEGDAPAAERSGACESCHEPIVAAARKATYPHPGMQQGCTGCHELHGAAKRRPPASLVVEEPALCARCHALERSTFVSRHLGYPTTKERCTSCHDPHGSGTPGMLWDHVHAPVASGQCAACHGEPTSRPPGAVERPAVALCSACHAGMLSATLARNRLHQPFAEGACLACHAPHASRERGLLRREMLATCGACHEDTIERQRSSPAKHAPIDEGRCTLCHAPHASDFPLLLTVARPESTCRGCHLMQGHGHQAGARRHPRNPNVPMDCMSCHRAHGTGYDHLLPVAKRDQLCVRCHVAYGR